ncbi:heme-binding protein [Woeseiaceae bacterium]|nr:heme-binding protein [Woeseiaceae bacterium]
MNTKKLVLLFAIFFGDIVSALEEPEFKVVDKNLNFEIRYYNEYLVAEVTLDGDFSSSGNQAFRVLAGYIFGANQTAEKMAMTAPVESQLVANSEKMAMTAPVLSLKYEDKHIYRFVMEKKYTLDSLPIPDDKRIRLLKIEPRYMAVKEFSGRWSEKNYKKSEQELLVNLNNNDIRVMGTPIFARYNAPFVPWFMRRNEVMVEINWRN